VSGTPQPVAHQFDDFPQQKQADTLGMWTFLATEILFFGGLFLAYAVYRWSYSETFAQASRHLDLWLGGINTAVLLTSSLTMALAVRAAQLRNRRAVLWLLAATIAMAFAFLAIKGFEYHHKFTEHLVPGSSFQFAGGNAREALLFFWLYFVLTGLHAIHVLVGVGVLGTLMMFTWRGGISFENPMPVEITGLYWHFVDIVWVFLYPLLYLIDRSQ
jgi:cytochrome c oxidase subunit 3